MKKFKVLIATLAALVITCGSLQVCLANDFDIDVEGTGDNKKIVVTIKGIKYELKLVPFLQSVLKDSVSVDNTSTENTVGEITLDKAKEIALADAGVTTATFQKEKTDYDDGRKVYELEFVVDNTEYDYEIDAETGSIRSRDVDYKKGSTTTVDTSGEITLEQAKEIALADAGLTTATFQKQKTDYDDGRKVYELEFAADNAEYEYEIDAATGNIRDKDVDYKNSSKISNTNKTNNTTATITSNEAEEIALADANVSRTAVKYINSHLDKDDGVLVYEVEFAVGNTEYDYDINADTGAIVSKDIDNH